MASSSWAVVAIAFVLAGCGSSPTDTPSHKHDVVDGVPLSESFNTLPMGEIPDGWDVHRGTWAGSDNIGQAYPKVMRATGQAEPGLSSLVAEQTGSFDDFEAHVSFQMLSGDHPQGAGLVIHYQDEDNYQIVRYSISENGWHLFVVKDGNRDKESEATIANTTNPGFGQWVRLTVISHSGQVMAFDGETLVLNYVLPPEAARIGHVGLFVRGNTVALFDDFSVGAIEGHDH